LALAQSKYANRKYINSMTLLDISLFFIAAVAGGAVNSVAGGGTFLVFPVLTMAGLSPFQANIMSTIALWPGTVSSAWGYRKELLVEKKQLKKFLIVSIIGSIAGTELFLHTSERAFERLVPWLILGATLLFTFGRKGIKALNQFSGEVPPGHKMVGRKIAGIALQLVIAVYGGYFGAGIGILMLAMLQLMGMQHIHQMNALKTVLGTAINAVAFVIFCFSGQVIWSAAPVMIIGAIIGGYVGARMALKVSAEKIRWLVSAIGFAMTMYYFLD
jgi:uncharacterized protein